MAEASLPYHQSIDGCLDDIGTYGLTPAELDRWLARVEPGLTRLRADHAGSRLELLRIVDETADIDAAKDALATLNDGARLIVFYGTGGSGLGGQTIAQLAGWNIPGAVPIDTIKRPRTRFYDNLDGDTLSGSLAEFDFATTRFVVTSKSGGTAETLAQAIAALSAVKAAGLEARIPSLFLGITEPARPGIKNGLRDLFSAHGIPMLDHPSGTGGRFSCLTTVGLLPGIARGVDPMAVRRGAKRVVTELLTAARVQDCAPALGAAIAVGLAKERGVKASVLMPYSDRMQKLSEWYVQLWAESLGKGGEGTIPIPATGPLDQHSQLQMFMDGPREMMTTILRVPTAGSGPRLDPSLAELAGAQYLGGRTVGDIVDAQSHALPEALVRAGRPVRTIDIPVLDAEALGAILMHFMLETILAGRALGLDPFDQPGVELAKVLTRERLER
ncbi:MAG: glucose-6-phosphate isomerase [Hyphomicrobium aestuarii]|nr:glucose-6-phosphate isomerase [Hyphomicrobium aestuarii]